MTHDLVFIWMAYFGLGCIALFGCFTWALGTETKASYLRIVFGGILAVVLAIGFPLFLTIYIVVKETIS
jgi:hypothetical protein